MIGKLTEMVGKLYDNITTKYYDKKGCDGKYYNGRHCEYGNDCHHKFIFHEQIYCLKKETADGKK